jgi:hypothetical protein
MMVSSGDRSTMICLILGAFVAGDDSTNSIVPMYKLHRSLDTSILIQRGGRCPRGERRISAADAGKLTPDAWSSSSPFRDRSNRDMKRAQSGGGGARRGEPPRGRPRTRSDNPDSIPSALFHPKDRHTNNLSPSPDWHARRRGIRARDCAGSQCLCHPHDARCATPRLQPRVAPAALSFGAISGRP